MSAPYVGQLLIAGFNFPPVGWAMCQGQLLPISQNAALFSLFGTYFGGDGKSNFALPNLQGAISNGQDQGPGLAQYYIGETAGSPTVTLLVNNLPVHNHNANTLQGRVSEQLNKPTNAMLVETPTANPVYYTPSTTTNVKLSQTALTNTGQNLPHNNMMPYLTLNWLVALAGVFPPRS